MHIWVLSEVGVIWCILLGHLTISVGWAHWMTREETLFDAVLEVLQTFQVFLA